MIRTLGRRQFLLGAGGVTLALPWLPSLVRDAKAGDFPFAQTPRLITFATAHGGIWGERMYPDDTTLTETRELFPGHTIRRGALSRTVSGGRASLSPVLTASEDRLTPALTEKMFVMRGLDIMFYMSHHTGGFLGNLGRHNGETEGGVVLEYVPTIDEVAAWSPSFYRELGGVQERAIHVGSGRSISWNYENPSARSGAVIEQPNWEYSQQLFDRVFTGMGGPEPRRPVVDRVIESYRRLRNGTSADATRLSTVDRQRLDAHMDRLSELERRLQGFAASCGEIPRPTMDARPLLDTSGFSVRPELQHTFFQLWNDVIVAAFMCGSSRIATLHADLTFSSYSGPDWHQEIAHQAHVSSAVAQDTIAEGHRHFFEHVFLDLVRKLDVEEANGKTFLDNSLVFWTQEAGHVTHDQHSVPIVAAGSAAGYFRTNQYLDYRNRANMNLVERWITGENPDERQAFEKRPGLTMNQFFGTVLDAMGVPRTEYARPGFIGYGFDYCDREEAWPANVRAAANDPLPWCRASTTV